METRKNQRFLNRLRFALAGIALGLRAERSLRTEAVVVLAVLVALAIVRPAPMWWALIILAGSAVLAAELFNTAIEHLSDHLHPAVHAEIRMVKDCAAAGVLISSIGAVGVAIALLIELLHHT